MWCVKKTKRGHDILPPYIPVISQPCVSLWHGESYTPADDWYSVSSFVINIMIISLYTLLYIRINHHTSQLESPFTRHLPWLTRGSPAVKCCKWLIKSPMKSWEKNTLLLVIPTVALTAVQIRSTAVSCWTSWACLTVHSWLSWHKHRTKP